MNSEVLSVWNLSSCRTRTSRYYTDHAQPKKKRWQNISSSVGGVHLQTGPYSRHAYLQKNFFTSKIELYIKTEYKEFEVTLTKNLIEEIGKKTVTCSIYLPFRNVRDFLFQLVKYTQLNWQTHSIISSREFYANET